MGFWFTIITAGKLLYHVPDKGHLQFSTNSLRSHYLLVIFARQEEPRHVAERSFRSWEAYTLRPFLSVHPWQTGDSVFLCCLLCKPRGLSPQKWHLYSLKPIRTKEIVNDDITRRWPLSYTQKKKKNLNKTKTYSFTRVCMCHLTDMLGRSGTILKLRSFSVSRKESWAKRKRSTEV